MADDREQPTNSAWKKKIPGAPDPINNPILRSLLLFTVLTLACQFSLAQVILSAPSFKLELNNKGRVTSLQDVAASKEYLYTDTSTVLLQVKTGNRWEIPSSMNYDRGKQTLLFRFPSQIKIEVRTIVRDRYLTFEITGAKPMASINRILWGSFATTINKTVGEIIGIVRDDNFAIGSQALNIRTTGGFPFNDEGYEAPRGLNNDV
jgi:hypothetical protein